MFFIFVRFLLNLRFFASPYFDHVHAFMHHALQALNTPDTNII